MQSVVNVRCQGDENPNTSVVAETMKFLTNSSYGYQLMDRGHHSRTSYMDDEKTRAGINKGLFERLGYIRDALSEAELAKTEVEHKKTSLFRLLSPALR